MEAAPRHAMEQPASPPAPVGLDGDPSRQVESLSGDRIYYPGLDGLRALAIALVYVFHDRELNLLNC